MGKFGVCDKKALFALSAPVLVLVSLAVFASFSLFRSVRFGSLSGVKKPRKGLCVCPPLLSVFSPHHPRRVCSRDHGGEACEAEEL
jgi:hypothetical protein